ARHAPLQAWHADQNQPDPAAVIEIAQLLQPRQAQSIRLVDNQECNQIMPRVAPAHSLHVTSEQGVLDKQVHTLAELAHLALDLAGIPRDWRGMQDRTPGSGLDW